ncbi:MAG TPA: GNAT family N-acetyltransferase [Thermoanaerobaculia bacterium]|nr:GNAT family N-acetyltransferase [Thermoanaerobaculia bacterium]
MQQESSKDLAVRPALPEDAPVIAGFQILMARETEGMELDPETVAQGVAAVFADRSKGEYLVAVTGERIVGCLMVTPEWSDWRNGTVLWIQSVYVVPEMRGRGVYRLLYEHMQARVAASPALRGIRLYVDKRNTAAQGVYARLGMTREHYELFEWMKE